MKKTLQELKSEVKGINFEILENLPEPDSLLVATDYLVDNAPSARDVLEDSEWKKAAYVVWYLCDKYPAIIEPLKKEWTEYQQRANKTSLAKANNLQAEPLLIGFEPAQ